MLAPCTPRYVRILALCALTLAAACGPRATADGDIDAGSDGNMPNEGDPVGSACDDKLDCDSPTTPACLTELKPMAGLAGVPGDIADLGLEFPGGYCSSVLNCASNADCGDEGTCYRPFREVTADTLRVLEMPLMLSAGTLDFLPAYGVCLRACPNGSSDCETGQICEIPMVQFVSLVEGSINDVPFCIADPSCPETGCTAGPCSPNPCQNGGTCTVDGTGFTCACPDGFSGPMCETQTVARDREIGEACTASAQCDVRGTPLCLDHVYPLEDVLPDTHPLSRIGLEFERGYCSNQSPCAADVQCGALGKCLAPFRNVTDATLRELENTFDPPLTSGSLDFLGGYGVCLRACSEDLECFSDQACRPVMNEFISRVPGSDNDGTYCVPFEDCRFCDPHAYCAIDGNDEGTCTCKPGYSGTGENCTATGQPACASNPCQNGGVCSDGPDTTYTCACPTGYRGTNCQIAEACSPNPCRNGGVCSATGAETFTCDCADGYSGPTCETESLCPALTAPANGDVVVSSQGVGGVAQYECDTGFMLSGNATRTCQASGAWTGSAPTCQAIPSQCSPNPCQHGGVCTPGAGSSFTCACTGTGHTGTTCQTPVDCGGLGTLAHGTISTSPPSSTTFGTTATYACSTGYVLSGNATRTCQASGAWSGTAPTCMLQASPCDPNPCQNGGTCAVNGSGHTCSCAAGYSGPNCETPFNCGALTAPANGTVTAASTTLGATATYACNPNFTLSGSATRTCQPTGWSGSAPTCMPSSCGSFTDVIYRLTGKFDIRGTLGGIGNQSFPGLTNNATTPPFVSGNNNTTPFTGGGTFSRGFARLRFTNNASGQPIAGTVRLVEWYFPLEFHQTAGAELDANVDHSVGILNNPGSLANCGGGNTTCTSHAPTVNRQCTANASGTLSGTTLNWGACAPAWTGQNSWSYASSARSAAGAGCATGYVQYGNNTTSSPFVPAAGKGDAYQVYNQQLARITFSGTSYATATWSMAEIQIPNGTNASNTWLTITSATPLGTDCGTTPGTDLVCNVQ